MPLIAFTLEWAVALQDTIDRSEEYRMAGASWTGPVILCAGDRAVYLELAEGRCLAARPREDGDSESARIVLSATPPVWMEIFGGSLDPIEAVLMKQVVLEKGSPMELLPHARSAKEILRSAVRMGTAPPPEWVEG